jgi:hypothetical protein
MALLSSCSVYDVSLLDTESPDPVEGDAGSLSIDPRGGSPARGGTGPSAMGGSKEPGFSEGGAPGDQPEPGTGGTAPDSGGAGGPGPSGGGGAGVAGGSGGSGGNVPQPTGVDVLDDMEDGNFYLTPRPPRYGYWYVAGDGTAAAMLPKIEELMGPLAPARDGSTSAVHFAASGFKGWGASLGLSFTDPASKRVKYDAGNATGVSFWVKGSVTGNAKVRVLFPLPGTDPIYELCGEAEQGQCLDHYATQISVTADWQHVTITFSSLHQAGWGAPVPAFDPTEMLGIEWSTGTIALDIWLDDLALIRP